MKIILRPRLKKIADSIIDVECLADIGTDHGYIPVRMIQEKRIKKAIACDINPVPLNRAQSLIVKNKLETTIETRLGSGLSVLKPREADGIVMAGMGGILISELLDECETIAKSAKRLILQPMNAQNHLRSFLEDHNYRIIEETLVREGRRIYEIMVVKAGTMKMDHWLEYELGYHYMENKDPLLKDFINRKLELEMRIIKETGEKKTSIAQKQFNKSSHYVSALKEVLSCL